MYEDLINKLRYCGNAVSCLHCPYWGGCEGSKEDLIKAANAIEELRKAVLRLEDESGIYDEFPTVFIYSTEWIPVTERLPDFDGCVLCMRKALVGDKLRYQDILYYDEGTFYMEFEDTPIPTESITHWMPLPEPPKEGE